MTYQTIKAGFKTDQAMSQAQQAVQTRLGGDIQALTPETLTAQSQTIAKTKGDIFKAALTGGLLGTLIGSFAVAIAPSSGSSLTVIAPLSGALVGSAAGSLISFLSGTVPGSVKYDYQLTLEVPIEAVQDANKIILEQGGHIL